MELADRLQTAFGVDALPSNAFGHFPFALRIELGGESGGHIPRFIRALDRARLIGGRLFDQERPVSLIFYLWDERPKRLAKASERLREIGLNPDEFRQSMRQVSDGDGGKAWLMSWDAAVPAMSAECQAAIFSAVGCEMGISPSLFGWSVWIADIDRSVAMHPYDDRGLDVISMSKDALAPLYREFGDWLLDHNRDEMDAAFAGESR